MTEPGVQRAWRASCSFCGAPVEFRSAASPMAVCSFCQSTLVREGEALRRIGQSAALFDDHSPLALGARGKFQGEPFTLIGRVQLAYRDDGGDEGRWSEWHALFDNGRSGCLSEDNGAYVFGFAAPAVALPDLLHTPIGGSVIVSQQPWVLSSRVQVRVHAAQGELAAVPDLAGSYTVVELRNTAGEVLSVEPQALPPRLDLGRSVQLADLALSGVADARQPSEAALKAKGHECPNCGSALQPTLDSSQSIVCGSCHAVVDISKGLGADLKFYRQDNTLEPLIALGTVGQLKVSGQVDSWQVVGYQERCDLPQEAGDEQTFWREYLLYNKLKGFAFLVDAEDGWSVVQAVTGVPADKGSQLVYRGKRFDKLFSYPAKTTYVLGEFYWPVKRDQRTLNTDYICHDRGTRLLLNREESGNEITWSAGEALDAKDVLAAFRIAPQQLGAFQRDAGPVSGQVRSWVFWLCVVIAVLMLIFLVRACSKDDCSTVRDTYGESSAEYQQCRANAASSHRSSSWGHSSGGSYGGYSSGGSHK